MSALDLTRDWLRNVLRPYAAKDRIEREVMSVLSTRRTLSVKTDAFTFDSGQTALLLLLHGTLPISFRGATYQIPVHVWIPHAYPGQAPLAFVVPTKDMGVRKGREVEPGGRVREDVVEGWWRGWSDASVEQLLGQLISIFSITPPVYAKPREVAAGGSGSVPASNGSAAAGPSQSRPTATSGPNGAPLPPARPFASPPPAQLGQPPAPPAPLPMSIPATPHPDSLPTYRPAPTPPPHTFTPPPHAHAHPHSHSRQSSAHYPAGPSHSPPVPPTFGGGPGVPPTPFSQAQAQAQAPGSAALYQDQQGPRTPPRPGPPGPGPILPSQVYAGSRESPQFQQQGYQAQPYAPPGREYAQNPQVQPHQYHQPQQQYAGGPPSQTPHGQTAPGPNPMDPHAQPRFQTYPNQPSQLPQQLQHPQPPVQPAAPPRAAAPDLMSSSSPESSFSALPSTSSPTSQPTAALSSAGPPPIPPSKPPPPSLLHLHSILLPHLSASLPPLLHSLHSTRTHLLERKEDLDSGEPAIRDEMARLEAVKKVCDSVGRRMEDVVRQGGERVADLEQRGEVGVDEVVCGISIVHNQLINLVAEDNAIEDTIYHMTRALDSERVDLDRFLKSIRTLAREQYMKRALIERILEGMGQKQGW